MFIKETMGEPDNIPLKGILETADVLLVVSSFMSTDFPSLGVHLLRACSREEEIDIRILYSNLLYSKLIGIELHHSIKSDEYLLLGERIFATAAFNLPSVSIGRVGHKFLDPAWAPDHVWQVKQCASPPKVPEPIVPFKEWLRDVDLEYLESLTVDWLNALARQIVNIGFRIVGCSTTFGGLLPAVALLNCVKKADPEVITIIGGALCEAEMAEGILSLNSGIDYIFSGEGEITFPPLVKQILDGRLPKGKIIYGQDVTDLDTIPLPDYRDYIVQKEKFHPGWSFDKNKFVFPFENSRGCWYGKCTFCSLNGKRNLFRSKSPEVIIQSLKILMKQHRIKSVSMSDNMMPFQYFDSLFPRLSAEIPSINIFYMTRADLSLDQVLSLKKAGITAFQPGIESLSPSLLRRMHKPYTIRSNIALLRYARSAGINLIWIFLFGFPGDQTAEYDEILRLLPLIRHLQPPDQMFPLKLYRFSKYQTSPQSFGISDLRPAGVYKETFPSVANLDKIAYYFSANFPSQAREHPDIITALWEEYKRWRNAWGGYKAIPLDLFLPTLHMIRKTPDQYILEDARGLPERPRRIEINREQASLLLVARSLEDVPVDEIRWAVDAGLGVINESWFIPLATAEPALLREFERDYQKDVYA